MAFYKIGNLLDSSITRSKTPKTLLALKVRMIFPKVLRELFKDQKSVLKKISELKPKTLKSDCLTIVVPSSLWAAQLRLQSGQIIHLINTKIGAKVVKSLRFRVGK